MPTTQQPSGRPVVVVTFTPDLGLDWRTFPGDGDPLVIALDLGHSFDGAPEAREQLDDFAASARAELEVLGADHPARTHVEEVIEALGTALRARGYAIEPLVVLDGGD